MKLFFASLLMSWIVFPYCTLAQTATLEAPKNLTFVDYFENSGRNSCTFSWQIVPQATGYRIDVALDSLFTNILPGLHNIPVLQHRIGRNFVIPPSRWLSGTTVATILGLRSSNLFYCRVRAENSTSTSPNSTTLSLVLDKSNCRVFHAIGTRDTSLTFQVTQAKPVIFNNKALNTECPNLSNANFFIRYEAISREFCTSSTRGPNFTSSSNTVTSQNCTIRLNNLSPNTNYYVVVLTNNVGFDALCSISTLPQQLAQYGNIISYYEGPLKHRLPPDSSVYYSRNDTTTTLQQAINLIQQVRSMGIAIDTMWFHASVVPRLDNVAFTSVPDPDREFTFFRPQACGFTVKLRQKDDRMLSLGFANRVGFWEYADNLTFYRYVFSGTTSVQIPSFALNSPLGVAPNPSNGEQTTLYYTLPQSSETSVVVVNLLGQRVFEEYLGFQHEGSHTIPLNIGHLPNGMYRVCLSATKNNAAYTMATQALTIVK